MYDKEPEVSLAEKEVRNSLYTRVYQSSLVILSQPINTPIDQNSTRLGVSV